MKDKQSYEDMLDIDSNSSSITLKNIKKKKSKIRHKEEQVKQELVDKVNAGIQIDENKNPLENSQESTSSVVISKKPKFKMSVVKIQLCVIGVLLAVILVTNALNINSGINVFLRGILGSEQTASVDNRSYFDFTPVVNTSNGGRTSIDKEGNLTIIGVGSAYTPCDGVVSSLSKTANGEYELTISHNDYFSSVITGLNYCYVFEGDKVYSNIPVGYAKDKNYSVCFLSSDGSVVTGYTIADNQVVWEV